MSSRIKSFAFTVTLDSNGDGTTTEKLNNDIIIGSPTAFKSGAFESVEFFNLYIYSRMPTTNDPVAGGGSAPSGGGGGGGGFGLIVRSPPALRGSLFRSGDELVVKIEAGVANASATFRVLIPYQVVQG